MITRRQLLKTSAVTPLLCVLPKINLQDSPFKIVHLQKCEINRYSECLGCMVRVLSEDNPHNLFVPLVIYEKPWQSIEDKMLSHTKLYENAYRTTLSQKYNRHFIYQHHKLGIQSDLEYHGWITCDFPFIISNTKREIFS